MPTLTYPTEVHTRLAALVGSWQGTSRTRFEPDAPIKEARTSATIRAVADGYFFLHEYESSLDGETFSGVVLYGFDQKRGKVTATWGDSYHTGPAMMISEGDADPDAIVKVQGFYDFKGQTWGWRTVVRLDGDELVCEAFNIPPGGEPYLAIETRLRRV